MIANIRQRKNRCFSFGLGKKKELLRMSLLFVWSHWTQSIIHNAIKRKIDFDVQPLSMTFMSCRLQIILRLQSSLNGSAATQRTVISHHHHQIIIITLRSMQRMYIFYVVFYVPHLFALLLPESTQISTNSICLFRGAHRPAIQIHFDILLPTQNI